MKRLLFFVLLIWSVAHAQTIPGYTVIPSRYKWVGGGFDAFNLPAGGTPAMATSQWVRAGALYYDSTGGNRGVHYWTGSTWIRMTDTTMSSAVTGTSNQIAFYAPTTGLLTGSTELIHYPASDPTSNTAGMFRVGMEDGVAGGLGPEIIMYSFGDDIGFVKNVHKNFYQGSSNGAAVGFEYLDAWGRSVQLYATSPFNAFGNSEALWRYTGKGQRYHVDTTGGYFSWGIGSLNTESVNRRMRLRTEDFDLLVDSVRVPGVDLTIALADSLGWNVLLQNRVTGTMARMNIGSIRTATPTLQQILDVESGTPLITGTNTNITASGGANAFNIIDFPNIGFGGTNITAEVVDSLFFKGLDRRTNTRDKFIVVDTITGKVSYTDGGGSSITAGYGLSGTTMFILDTTIAVNKAGQQIIVGNKTFTGTTTWSSPNNSFWATFNIDNSGNAIYNYNIDPIFRRSGANKWTYSASLFSILTGVGLTVDGATLYVDQTNNRVGALGSSPTSTLYTAGSFGTLYAAKTSAYPLTETDHTIEVTTGTFNVTLPTAVGIAGRQYTVTNTGTGVTTLATTSSQTFANVTATPTTLTLNQFYSATVVSNGANWLLVSSIGF